MFVDSYYQRSAGQWVTIGNLFYYWFENRIIIFNKYMFVEGFINVESRFTFQMFAFVVQHDCSLVKLLVRIYDLPTPDDPHINTFLLSFIYLRTSSICLYELCHEFFLLFFVDYFNEGVH